MATYHATDTSIIPLVRALHLTWTDSQVIAFTSAVKTRGIPDDLGRISIGNESYRYDPQTGSFIVETPVFTVTVKS